MALLEETVTDPEPGASPTPPSPTTWCRSTLTSPDLDVLFVGESDRFNPIGVKGVAEMGPHGIAAAITNAVFHATGRRIRSLPITIEQLP
jgi:xanthine dehydrogenase YagR molybdenum-binding subunit